MIHLDDYQLNEYLDGVMTVAQRQQAVAHLAECSECRAALADLAQLFTALEGVSEQPLMTDLTVGVLATINAEGEVESWLRPLLVIQVLAAAGMVTLLWPTLQTYLIISGTAVQTALAQLQPDPFSIWQRLSTWGTAVLQQTSTLSPTIDLLNWQWGLLLGLALAAWLAGNRMIFTNEN